MSVISIKIQLHETVRRARLDLKTAKPYDALLDIVHTSFPEAKEFQLKFQDEEDEFCTVSSNDELLEAVNVTRDMNRSSVKLLIFPSNKPEVKHQPEVKGPIVDAASSDSDEDASKPELVGPCLQRESGMVKVFPKVTEQPEQKIVPEPEPEPSTKPEEAKTEIKVNSEAKADNNEAKAEAKTEIPPKEEVLALAIDFFQQDEITAAIPEVVRLFARDLHEVKDEKSADDLVDRLVQFSPFIAAHPLVQVMLPRIRPCLVKKLPFVATHSTAVNEHVSHLLNVLPQLLTELPDVLAQVLESMKEGGQRICAPFSQLMPLVGPLMFQMKQSMRQAFQDMPQFGAGCNPFAAAFGHGHPFMRCSMRGAAQGGSDSKIHTGIYCDGCSESPIQGVRFHCTVCPDYDLCSTCEAKDIHPAEHPLIKMRVAPRNDIHHNVACDACGMAPITGPRFKCSQCHNYDLCQACEAKNEHPASHPLIKMRVAAKGRAPLGFGHGFHGHGMRAGRHGMKAGRHGMRSGHGGRHCGSHGMRSGHGGRHRGGNKESRGKGCGRGRHGRWAQLWAQMAAGQQETPSCSRESCGLRKHSIQRHGYCCFACKQGRGHGPRCEAQAQQGPQARNTEENKATQVQPQQATQVQPQQAPQQAQPQQTPQQAQPEPNPEPEPESEEAPVQQVSPSAPSGAELPVGPFADQLHALRTMGFSNNELNLRLLQRYRGNVPRAIDWLLSQ